MNIDQLVFRFAGTFVLASLLLAHFHSPNWLWFTKESKAMADQIATVSKLRLFKRAGALSEEDMLRIGEVIKIQLDIY